MILFPFLYDFGPNFQPPRPIKTSKTPQRGIKNQKIPLSHLHSKMIPKSDQKSSNLHPKMLQIATNKHLKSMPKIMSENKPKNLDFGLKNGLLFWRFWHPKSTSKGSWSPTRSQKLNFSKNIDFLLPKMVNKQQKQVKLKPSGIKFLILITAWRYARSV